jgi:hypothetical protein
VAFWNKKVNENSSIVNMDYTPSMNNDVNFLNLTEQFKGQTESKAVKFPNELGEEHPFDFKQMEELYKRFGFFTAVVDKYIDYIWGSGFYIVCEDERAKKIIDDFNRDINMDTLGRQWTKEGLIKGNGFLELGGTVDAGIEGLKVLNANYMYVNRDKMGNVLGFKQYVGMFDKFSKEKVIDFSVEQIAHFAFNIVGDSAYGIGMGLSPMKDVDNLLQNEKDMHWIGHRKANSPLHATLGRVDGNTKIIPKPSDVTAFGQKMETMDNKTNWATDDLVKLSVVDFGNVGDKFTAMLNYDIQKLIYDYQIPAVIMGISNVPEGLAKVQMEGFQRRIQSIQAEIEKIIEEKIYKRVLNANGIDADVEFEWGTPSILEVEGRLKLITDMVKSPATGMAMRTILENELINLLKLDKDEFEQLKVEEEEARAREEEAQMPVVPGQNTSFPQKTNPNPVYRNQTKPVPNDKPVPTNQSKPVVTKKTKEINEGNRNYEYAKICQHCSEKLNNEIYEGKIIEDGIY